MTDIALCSIQELVDELNRRCSALVVACQHFEEASDLETPTTYSVIEGNFVHIRGLVDLLDARSANLVSNALFPPTPPADGDGDD